jgi:serine/threonine protein kinase
VDIWAIGAIAHELVTASDPFKIKNSDDLNRIINEDFEMHEGTP